MSSTHNTSTARHHTDDPMVSHGSVASTATPRGDVAAARRALLADAAGSFGFAALFTLGATVVRDHLGIPTGWAIGLGLFTLLYAADLTFVARGLPRRMGALRGFAFGNLTWVALSVLVLVLGVWPLTGLGIAFVLLQAAVVAAYAVAQLRALR